MQIYTNIFFFNKKIREGHPAMVNVCFRPWWDGSQGWEWDKSIWGRMESF